MNRIEQLEKEIKERQIELEKLKLVQKFLTGEIVVYGEHTIIKWRSSLLHAVDWRRLNWKERMLACRPDGADGGCVTKEHVILYWKGLPPLVLYDTEIVNISSQKRWSSHEGCYWVNGDNGYGYGVPSGELDCDWKDTLIVFKELEV